MFFSSVCQEDEDDEEDYAEEEEEGEWGVKPDQELDPVGPAGSLTRLSLSFHCSPLIGRLSPSLCRGSG